MTSEIITEELEVLQSIYESSIIAVTLENYGKEIIYTNKTGLHLSIKIEGNYPHAAPYISAHQGSKFDMQMSNLLTECASENLGTPMLHVLISKAIEVYQTVPTREVSNESEKESTVNDCHLDSKDLGTNRTTQVVKEQTICSFYLKGKCRFGEKCKNSHVGQSKPNSSPAKTHSTPSNVNNNQKKETKSENISSKKAPMKTAIDVINRILWDEALPTQNFSVGYLDRFIGVIEKPFSAFSWEDIASVDYNVLAIPKHRIQYFKYCDVIVWDKTQRLDKMFGSTGNTESIWDIVAETHANETHANETVSVKEPAKECQKVSKTPDDANRPNHFLCIRITDPQIRRKVEEAQDHILVSDNRLKDVTHDADRLHVTLCMFRLNNDDEKSKAADVLKSFEMLLPCLVPMNSFKFDVKYVDHFRRRVVYASVCRNLELSKLASIAQSKLKDAGIHLCGNHDEFTPHLTMFKLTRPFSKETQVNEINPFVFEKIKNTGFGTQSVDSLRICETGPERGVDNFYVTLISVKNRLLNISNRLPPLIAQNINIRMSQGIIDEGEGDSLFQSILSTDGDSFEKSVLALESQLNQNTTSNSSRKVMLIMRGLPGSGKSFLSKELSNCSDKSVVVCTADDFFEQGGEKPYRYSGTDIEKAHKHCRDNVINAMHECYDVIIVDNTHSQRWEYRVYERLAVLCGYDQRVVEITCNGGESQRKEYQQRCKHHVKESVHKDMYSRWEIDPQAVVCSTRDRKHVTLEWIMRRQDRPILYSALFLDKPSSQILLNTHPSNLAHTYADHMTIMHQPTAEHLKNLPVGTPFRLRLDGYIGNRLFQVALVHQLELRLCTQNRPHITIATCKTTRPVDVKQALDTGIHDWSSQRLVLTGVVGVKIAVNETESVKCTDNHYFKKTYLTPFDEKADVMIAPSDSGAGGVGAEEDEDKEVVTTGGIYTGPTDVVKYLNIFDFDGTLFFTPDPVEGRQEYQRTTGKPWPHKGWLGRNESLEDPLHVYPGPTLSDYRQNYDRACSYNVLCTGRLERVRKGVEGILTLHGMTFDRTILKPNDGQQYSRTNVKNYKRAVVMGFLKEFPHLEEVNFWDDRVDNIEAMKSLSRVNSKTKYNLYHIKDRSPNNLYRYSTTEIFKQLGLTQDDGYAAAVEETMEILQKAWFDVLNIKESAQDLVLPFGSYLLKRRSDVDVCLLAPTMRSPDECINKLAEKLGAYGLQFVHAATGIRCPRLKLKFTYCNYASVCFDVVVACVLENFDGDFDLVNAYKGCKNKKSKIALDGVVFHVNVITPILDRISETDFGFLMDSLVILLRRKRMKGNAFHCMRTFHLVHMLVDFFNKDGSLDLIRQGGEGDLDDLKTFEKLLRSVLENFASLSFEDLQSRFKGFVPDSYIQPLLDCFVESRKLSIVSILFGAALPSPSSSCDNNMTSVTLELSSSQTDVQRWRHMSLLEARVGTFGRQLIDRGFAIIPNKVTDCSVSFYVSPAAGQGKILEELAKIFVKDFEKECQVIPILFCTIYNCQSEVSICFC